MKLSKKLLTVIVSIPLAITGSVIAFISGWLTLVPLIFGIGIPLVNMEKPLLKKIGLILLIAIANLVIFLLAVLVLLNLPYEKYVLPAIAEGFAGMFILMVNGLFIKTIKVNYLTCGLTFLLSTLAIPLSMWLIASFVEDASYSVAIKDFFKQYGGMMLWMFATTAGVAFAIKEGPAANVN